jgi:hypothetical protein
MGMRRTLLLTGIAAVLLLLAVLFCARSEPAPDSPSVPRESTSQPSTSHKRNRLAAAPRLSVTRVVTTNVRGTVRDEAGAAVAGARVSVTGGATSVVTGGDGAFHLELPADEAVLRIDAANYVSKSIRIRPGEEPIAVLLIGCAVVSGRILDATTHLPLADHAVLLKPPSGGPMSWASRVTDATGRFHVSGLPANKLKVAAFRGGQPRGASERPPSPWIEVTPPADDLELLVGLPSDAITGVVVNADGTPYTGRFFVVAQPRDAMGALSGGGTFGAQRDGGGFSVAGFPESEMPVDVHITPDDLVLPMVRVQRPAMGGRALRVELPPSAKIGGRVTGVEAPRFKNVLVIVRATDGSMESIAVPDATGAFVTPRPVTVGLRYEVIAVAPDDAHGSGAVRSGVAAGQTDVALELQPMLPIRGRVVDAASGTGMQADIEGWSTNPPRRMAGLLVTAGAQPDGRFELFGVPGLTYWLAARGAFGVHAGTEVAFAPGAEGVEIRLAAGTAVSGILLDADGGPVAGAVVRASRPEDADRPWLSNSGTTGKDGAFRIDGMRAGRIRLITWRKGREVPLGEFDAPAPSLEVRLPR